MKLSEFTHTPFVGPSGLTWVYRQAGVALGNEIKKMVSQSVSAQSMRKLMFMKKQVDGGERAGDAAMTDDEKMTYAEVMRDSLEAQSSAALLAFRVCATEVKTLEDSDGKPIDLAAHRTDVVTVGGVPVKALTLDFISQIDSGMIGDDIRALGEKIVSEAKMDTAQKKT